MSSVLLLSQNGDGIPVAIRLAQEGHIVKVYASSEEAKNSLKGFRNPTMIPSPKMLEQYDLILYDMVGEGESADELKAKGRTVLGGGKINDSLELNRDYGSKVADQLTGMTQASSEKASSPKELKSLLEEATSAKVIKPLGNATPSLTLVSEDKQNRTLKSLLPNLPKDAYPCLVQDKIAGVEISSEAWFDGKRFQAFNHTIEHKRLMEGNLGPQTGCMGNTVWATKGDRLTETIFTKKLASFLERAKYLGPIDANCILTEDKAYFLEWTTRFGYDAIQALCELIRLPLFEFLWRLSLQQDVSKLLPDYSIAVRLTVPPYPNNNEEALALLPGTQFLDIPKAAQRHIFLSDVMQEGSTFLCAGVDGVLGCVTARGNTITEARRRVYRTLSNIIIHPDVQYRKDIGAGVEASISQLKQWGWLNAEE